MTALTRRLRDWIRAKRLERRNSEPLAKRKQRYADHIQRLRRLGVRIGDGCTIFTDQFSTEPYLVTIGDRVNIAGGTMFITHDGAVAMIRDVRPEASHFGPISVGDDSCIGANCIILPGTTIGRGCLVGAGTVVRGTIPDNSLVVGNPGKVVGRASAIKARLKVSADTLDIRNLPLDRKRDILLAHFGLDGAGAAPEQDGGA